jgi:branched-chain amino acid transport system substrate-binding protein
MKNLYIGVGAVVIVVIAGVAFFAHSKPPQNPQTIKIGAVLGLTGEAAEDSLNVKRGIELARQDLAKKGVSVEIIYEDDHTDPKQTVSAIQHLAATEQPQAIIGPIWSFLQSAAGPVLATQKLISFAPADTSEFADIVSTYEFQGGPLNSDSTKPVAEWLKTNHKTHVAIISDDSAWGKSVAKAYREAAQQAGATVVVEEQTVAFASDAPTVTVNALLKAKAQNADVVLWTGYEPEAVALVKKRLQLNYLVPVIANSTVYQQLLSAHTVGPKDLPEMYYLSTPISQEFVAKFKAAYSVAPGNYADRAYDGLMILADAIQHAPAQDADSLATYIRTSTHYKGYAGTYEFNEQGDIKNSNWVIASIVGQ